MSSFFVFFLKNNSAKSFFICLYLTFLLNSTCLVPSQPTALYYFPFSLVFSVSQIFFPSVLFPNCPVLLFSNVKRWVHTWIWQQLNIIFFQAICYSGKSKSNFLHSYKTLSFSACHPSLVMLRNIYISTTGAQFLCHIKEWMMKILTTVIYP